MSELRYSVTTGEWVVFAPERARRPEDFLPPVPSWTHQRPECLATCPFCPGNEERTPGVTLSYEEEGSWAVRSFPNRFPAVYPGLRPHQEGSEFFRHLGGVGHHEVVAESPFHNTTLALMTADQVGLVLKAWRDRYRALWSLPETEHVVVFKNHGQSAGCSLEHPHSQIVSLPVIPRQILERHEVASRYYVQHNRCVFCAQLESELEDGRRILQETQNFVAFIPYAAFSPFSIWVLPRRHSCCFGQTSEAELSELATILQQLLARLYRRLSNPDYNLVIRSSHPEVQGKRVFHWYLTVVPRLARAAGFELGTGMFINPSTPETDCQFLSCSDDSPSQNKQEGSD